MLYIIFHYDWELVLIYGILIGFKAILEKMINLCQNIFLSIKSKLGLRYPIANMRTSSNPPDIKRFRSHIWARTYSFPFRVNLASAILLPKAYYLYYRQLSTDIMRIIWLRTSSNPPDIKRFSKQYWKKNNLSQNIFFSI